MRLIDTGLLLVCGLVATEPAYSQSMTPMRGEINSYSDEFALKVYPKNVYDHSIDFVMKAYDQDFDPIEAMILPESFSLGAGSTRPVTVVVAFGSVDERKIRVCAESIPFPKQQNLVKARICGRFLARRLH